MKTKKWMMGVAAATMLAGSCSTTAEAHKVLVLYYSQTSNTKAVAEMIADKLGADIEEVVAVNPYDGDFNATIERCMREREDGVTPEIQPLKADISKYDVIFIGYPVWFGTFAPPIITMLDRIDLSGKQVVPFCTFGSGGLESSVKDLVAKQPNAEILEGYGVRAARMDAAPQEVNNFLIASGFIKGEYTKPGPFSEPHAVNNDETAIFDAAVGDYPMMNANATNVATRVIPNGMEYLFTAVDKPRDKAPVFAPSGDKKPRNKKPKMPPPGEMKVYVTVVNGESPVFTRVVR